jgi:hypothetical protein
MQVIGEAASDVPESVRLQGATPLRRVQAALACGESQLDDAAVAHAIAKVLAPAVCSSTSTSSNTSSSSSSSSSSSAELKRFATHFVLQARRQFPECMQESAATATANATAADANSASGSDSDSAATGSDSGTDANAEDRKMRKKAYEAADDILCAYIDHLRYCSIIILSSVQLRT